MAQITNSQRWAALCLASLLGIGIPNALYALAKAGEPKRPPAAVDQSTDWDIDSRRTC